MNNIVELSKKHLCVLRNEGEEMLICTDMGKISEEGFDGMFEGCFDDLSENELDALNDCPFHNHWMSEQDINEFIVTCPELIKVGTWEQAIIDDVNWAKEVCGEEEDIE